LLLWNDAVDPSSLTTETFDSGSNFPTSVSVADTFGAGTETGMTAKKIIEGRRILRHYENDMEAMECHLALSSTQEADLLSQVEVISREYRDVPVMEDGKIVEVGTHDELLENADGVYSKLVRMQLEMNKVKLNFIDEEGEDDTDVDVPKSEDDTATAH